MTIWAIVPVKPLRRGKSRLAPILSEDERAVLNRKLFIHTLEVLKSAEGLEQILVVSRDPEALALAREYEARTLQEDGAPHLNIALERATMVARTYNARGVLILPADLPQLTVADVMCLLAASEPGPVVVLAPDHHGSGTNALLVNPAGLIAYDFGEDSYASHVNRTEAAGARVATCNLPGLAQDIDLPEDLERLNGQATRWWEADALDLAVNNEPD